MKTNFADRIFRVSFILVFIVGMIVMPSTRAIAQSPCPSSMVSYWRADGDVTDSIDGNDGILNGATYLAGRVGLGFATNVNQYITVPDSPNLHIPQNITIEAWIHPSTSIGDRVILSKGNSNFGDGWHMMLRQNNTLAFHARYGTAWEITQTSDTIAVGIWHHIAYTYDGSQAKLYIDGVEKASHTFTAPIQQNTRPFKIGTVDQNIAFFVGLIDEVAVYNTVLSESELNGHYDNGMAGQSYCEVPASRFRVSPVEPPDQIWGEEWAPDSEVVIEIDDPDTAEAVDFSTTAGTGMNGRFELHIPFDIQAGHVVTISQGTTVKSHIVIDLRVTSMNHLSDTISGIGAPETETVVTVWDEQLEVAQSVVTSGDSGAWTANFSPAFDIQPGMWSTNAQADEDGDSTMIVGHTPNFLVFLDWIGLAGGDWPPDVNVQVTADDPETASEPDVELTLATNAEGFFEGAFMLPVLRPGWLITVTDGSIAMTHTVRAISITDVDTATERVRGIADPGTEVWVAVSGGPGVFTTADSSGEWVANFSGMHDIRIGSELGVQEKDEQGNGTYFGYTVPFPPIPIPSGTSLTTPGGGTRTSGTPTVYWQEPITISTTGPSGGTGTATLTMSDGYELTITWVESPPSSGTYTATFLPLSPNHGPGLMSFIIHDPDGNDQQGSFTLYIDPSGVVRDTFGNPVVGATVTLYRSVDPVGPFVAVSDGSALMSPGNRTNPDLTDANGLFGWDVVPGFYRVRAEKVGCSAPDGGAFVETAVMTIPPPVTDLELILKCQEPPVASAGGPYTVEWGAVLTLDGSGSTDPNNNIASYEWDLDGDGGYDDASGVTITTSFHQLGEQTVGLRVTDDGGLNDSDTAIVTVFPWTLKGFYQPVDMDGVYNIIKNGSTVPMKFEIFAGATELTDPTYITSLTYTQTSCDSDATTDNIESTTTGGTSLRYDVTAGQFIYNWKTPKTPGKCYRVTLITVDGSSLIAYFKLK